MQHRDYLDLDLVVETTATKGYRVRAACTAARLSASADFTMPFSEDELAAFVAAVTPGGTTRRLAPTVPAPATPSVDVRTMGERLFGAAFTGDLGPCLVESIRSARTDQNKGLRVRLHLANAPELGRIPWEFLFSDFLDRYLALSTDTPVVRYLDVPSAVDPLPVTLPLRVVVVVSDPVDAPGLDVKRETELLQATTADLQKSGLLSLEFLEAATLSNLQHRLYEPMHVFHFIGHGAYDEQSNQGTLLFEDEQKKAVRVSATRLATLLHDAPDLRLAVLNSCEGARGSTTDPFSGVAQTLLRQGLPSAVAMQSEISDRAAIAFAHEFYFALCRGADVDAATSEGRKAVFSAGNDIEWGTPVLFLRSEDARLFEVADEPAEPSRDQHWDALYAAAQSALAADEAERAKSLLEQLASESPDYKDVTALLPQVSSQAAQQQSRRSQPVPGPRQGDGRPVVPDTWFRGGTKDSTATTGGQTRPRPGPGGAGTGSGPGWTTPQKQEQHPRRRFRWGRVVFGLVLLGVLAFGIAVGYQAYLSYTHTMHAAFAGAAITTDALDGDWPSGAKTYHADHLVIGTDNRGVRASWRLAWDQKNLYVFADVSDLDPSFLNAGTPALLYKGDSVAFEIGPDASNAGASDGLRLADQYVMIGPDGKGGAVVAVNPAGRAAAGNIDFEPRGLALAGTRAGARTTTGGYAVEAAIPWAALGLKPGFDETFSMNLDVNDSLGVPRKIRGVYSNNPKLDAAHQLQPANWFRLSLDRSSG